MPSAAAGGKHTAGFYVTVKAEAALHIPQALIDENVYQRETSRILLIYGLAQYSMVYVQC